MGRLDDDKYEINEVHYFDESSCDKFLNQMFEAYDSKWGWELSYKVLPSDNLSRGSMMLIIHAVKSENETKRHSNSFR